MVFDKAKTLMELKKLQSQLAKEVIEVSAGDGAVTVQMTGELKVKQVSLDQSKIDDFARLEKWLESAFTQALTKSQQAMADKMKGMGGDLGSLGL